MPVGAAVGVGTAAVGSYSARKTAKATEKAAKGELQAAQEAQVLGEERFGRAEELLAPSLAREEAASQQLMVELGLAPGTPGTAFMQTPAYTGALEAGRNELNQSLANSGLLHSGRRMEAAAQLGQNVQQQFYSNYMNMLGSLAQPQVAQNLSSLGVGQAATMGAQNIGAQSRAGGLGVQGQAVRGAAYADIAGSVPSLMSQYGDTKGSTGGGFI